MMTLKPTRGAMLSSLLLAGATLLAGCSFSSADRTRIDDRVEPAQASIDDEGHRLTPLKRRVTDAVIRADLDSIGELQERIAKLNDAGRPLDTYHMCKAQAWLDFGRDEYSENDRSGVANAALRESLILIQAMEAEDAGSQEPLPMDTPLIETSVLLREDLWELVERLKSAEGYSCSECLIAKLEVELVWSGHEQPELGWRHAAPYIRIAERLAREAEKESLACNVEPLPACNNMCAAAPVEALPPTNVHFARDKSYISPTSALLLNRLGEFMRKDKAASVTLVGHTDPYNSKAYNQALAARRTQAVKDYLVAWGIKADRVRQEAAGESTLFSTGCTPKDHALNRRVEVQISGSDMKAEHQESDLQIDSSQQGCRR